jgi:hypothetical protein
MGPAARPNGGQGFTLASPRPGGGPPSGRPTSELLGSATFQTPEGESTSQSIFISCLLFFCFVFGWFWNVPSPDRGFINIFVLTAPAVSGWPQFYPFVSIFALLCLLLVLALP